MKEAVNYARRGNSSVLIEALTYRCKGYAEHDNQSYVPSGEIDFWAEHNDPITRYEKFLNDEKILNQEEMKKIVAEVSEYLEAEAAIADEGEMPEPISAAYEVFDNLVVSPAFKKKVLER